MSVTDGTGGAEIELGVEIASPVVEELDEVDVSSGVVG